MTDSVYENKNIIIFSSCLPLQIGGFPSQAPFLPHVRIGLPKSLNPRTQE